MDDYVARAFQIACLNENDVQRIHAVEARTNELLTNWNIQEMLGVGSIKDKFNIPEDAELQSRHARRVKAEIDGGSYTKGMLGFPSASNLPAMHDYDYEIYRTKDTLPFEFTGRSGRGKSLAESI